MQKFTEVVASTTQSFWGAREFGEWYSTNLSKVRRCTGKVQEYLLRWRVGITLYYVRDETEEEKEVREHKKKADDKRAWDSAMWTIKVMKERGYVDE